MIELENYKSNLDVVDTFEIKNVKINKGAVFTGKTDYINEEIRPPEHKSPVLAAATLGLDNTAAPNPENSQFYDVWTDIDAQEIQMRTKPTCYLIFGKAGTGAFSLGELLAKKFKCIHLCPKNILEDEIAQNSTTGRTWDFNMRHNKVCLFDMILKMLKIKLNSPAVQHRGYVLSDLPLVTNSRNPLYYIDSLHSEEAFLAAEKPLNDTITNFKRKKTLKHSETPHTQKYESFTEEEQEEEEEDDDSEAEEAEGQQAEEIVVEEEEGPAELPKFTLNFCSDILVNKKAHFISQQVAFLDQLQEIFNLCLPPDVIIHITIPDITLAKKRGNRYINYITGQNYIEPFHSKYVAESGWPAQYVISDYEPPIEAQVFQPKYNCRPPDNFEDKVIEQICNYRRYIIPYIEKKLKDYDPKMVIELDGRTTVARMFHQTLERLILLPIQPIFIPEPLYLEDPPEDMDDFWATVAGLKAIRSGDVSFKYYASSWFNRCPVELQLRRTVVGIPKYAVRFFKHVYLLSSLNNFISFCRNPRPYLKLEYLEPTCRVIVTGTKGAGKTMLSQCLSWIFDTPVTDFNKFIKTEKEKKNEAFTKTVLSEIIATIEDVRFLDWQSKELDRVTKLNKWCETTLQLLTKYVPLLVKSLQYKKEQADMLKKRTYDSQENIKEEVDEFKVENERTLEKSIERQDPGFLKKFNAIRVQLSYLPILDCVEECQIALSSKNVSQYAAIELTTVTSKPPTPVIGDEDVTIAISNYIVTNDLQKELEPTTEELMTELVKFINAIDTQHQENTNSEQMYGKYIIDGFPSDPEYWGYLKDPKLIPDYTIAVIETREIDQDLYQYYINAEKYTKHYDEKILLAKDPLLHTKLQATKPSKLKDLDMQIIVNNIINNALDYLFITKKDAESNKISDTNIEAQMTSFTEAIEKFREHWDSIKIKLEDKSKSCIEIELQNKSDVEIIEEMLLKLRQCYCRVAEPNEEESEVGDEDEDDSKPKDLLTYNDHRFLCETSIYCPIAYYVYNVLWEGKPEFSLRYDNKIHYFSKEEFVELFRKNVTKYQSYNRPYKKLPKLKIDIVGPIGSGRSSIAKHLGKELGLLHIDFANIILDYMMPKHFKKVGRHYENIFIDQNLDEEAVVEFQMDEENPNTDMLANELEMRRMIYNYYERGTPITSGFMQDLATKIWFDPFVPAGFVIDGYPRLPQGLEDMLACYCIPDMVIILDSTMEVTVNRMGPKMFTTWKSQQKEAKKVAKIKLDNEYREWMHTITKKIVVKLIIEEILETTVFSKAEAVKGISAQSVIMDAHPSGSVNVDPTLFNAYNQMVQECPEPKDSNIWESDDEARDRIEARIESIFDFEYEKIQILKEILFENKVKTAYIDVTKSLDKVIRDILSKLSIFKHRNESFFEQTFITDTNTAENLLLRGYYLLSKFYRLCPVYMYENPQAILNSYKICKNRGTIFPVIHRTYIYFISNEDNVRKFRTNPLKYITSDALKSFVEYPLRIAVLGAPNSGQTYLAAKLAKQYGLICISRGKAVRMVLQNLYWTEQACRFMENLEEGRMLDDDFMVKAIQSASIDHRTATYGFVYDGLPATPYQAKGLVKNGLFPNVIFDIHADKSKILDNARKEIYYDILKYKPPYPYTLIEKRYGNWKQRRFKLRTWINEDYQNIYQLDGNQSKWHLLQQANDHIKELTTKIHHYVSNVDKQIVSAMIISNEAFAERQSQYKNMCPVCFHKKVYRHMGMGHPGDKKGVVQYKNKFYWICDEHVELVMMFPDYYLTNRVIEIPEIPVRIKIINIDYIFENGICVVTYADNLPAQKIVMGTNEFAASYAGKSYLFCSELCLYKFLDKPQLYKDTSVFKGIRSFPQLCLKKLPNIGYLEQTLANILTEACCSVNVFRPKYPGLTFHMSALIHIALYLKANNPLMLTSKLPSYLKAFRVFEARCKLVLNVGLRLRSMDNPFATYPKCHHRPPTLRPVKSEEEMLSSDRLQRPSSASHRASSYVQIRKPSFGPPKRVSRITSQLSRK